MSRAVVTPENLSRDFTIDLLRADGPVGLNLDPVYFRRDPLSGVIQQVQVPLALDGLSDVATADAQNGEVLTYDAQNGQWKAATLPPNFMSLNLIGTSTTLANRPATAANGAAWGLIESNGALRIFIYTPDGWFDAGPINSPEAFPTANVIFVQEFGSNARSGTSWSNAVRSIERALELATERNEPTLIEWAPEAAVVTQGNLDMPDNCVIRAAHRTVFLRPQPGYEQRNVIRMGSGCFVEGIMFEGWQVDSLTNPTSGFAISFRPGAVINRVPYAHKIAVRTDPSWGLVPPPLDRANSNPAVPRGGGVVLADGLVCSPYSRFANIMTWGATPVTPNGIGYCAKNRALINAVNAVSMWGHRHFYALTGGQIILSSCSTQFGDYSMHADGRALAIVPAAISATLSVQEAAATAIGAAQATIINSMWDALVAGGYTATWTAQDQQFTRADAAQWLQCVRWVLQYANPKPATDFAKGLFNRAGQRVFDAGMLPAFVFSFNQMRDSMIALGGVNAASDAIIIAVTAALNSTLTTPVGQAVPSKITAIGHTWTGNLAGVALAPSELPEPVSFAIQDSILETNDGVVITSGQDDKGNALFVGGLTISADTGELGGPPFEQAVRRIANRAAIARSF